MGSNKITKENCLGIVSPDILSEWDYAKNVDLPDKFAIYSTKRVWWKCKNGHSWDAVIQSRTKKNGRGCPYCGGYFASQDNNLFINCPAIMEEWNYEKNLSIDPSTLTMGTGKKVWWKCNKGHEWEATVNSRVSNGNGCPYCSNKKVNDENSLGTLNPKLSRQWHPTKNGYLQPNDVTEKSGKRVWWKCNRGHEWKSTIAHRSNGRCCPKCSKIVLKDGTVCDSKVEAYYYLSLINQGLVKGVDFKHNGYYCQEQDHFNEFGKIRYDFYLIKQNKYIEITSFTKEFNKWVEYFCNVLYKYQFVNIVLGDHFEFIQKTLTSEENNIVTKNME